MPRMTISLEEAQNLSENKSGINLDITSGLTADIASLLIKTEGHLSLNKLTLLRDDVAEILASFPNELQLGGAVLTASHQAIEKLVQHRGPKLSIQRLSVMDLTYAKHLSKHVGNLSISCRKADELTEDVLIELASHQGDLCIFQTLELTEASIKAFLKHKGDLMLPLVSNMNENIAKQFKKHDGPVSLPGRMMYVSY
jgi:hypothetical protein